MIVSYLGRDSFKVSQGDLSLLVNPQNNRTKSDVSLFTTGHPEVTKEPFVIFGPGEYEVKDIGVKGFLSEGAEGKINTIYVVSFEGMNLCFLGSLSNPALPAKTLENLEDIDILFVPADTMDPAAGRKLAVSLEPSIIIPFGDEAKIKAFVKESGEEAETTDKLVLKKKDLEGREGDIIILKEE